MIYIDTKEGDLSETIPTYFAKYNIKTCYDFNQLDQVQRCICSFIIYNNNREDIDITKAKKWASNLKQNSKTTINIAIIYIKDIILIKTFCHDYGIVTLTQDDLEYVLEIKSKFFLKLEEYELDYEKTITMGEEYRLFYEEELLKIFLKRSRCY